MSSGRPAWQCGTNIAYHITFDFPATEPNLHRRVKMKKTRDTTEVTVERGSRPSGDFAQKEIERVNAKLRHFRGVAASVMKDAFDLWNEIWTDLQDNRCCEEILEGVGREESEPREVLSSALLEKLHLLGIHIDYARRLCDGSIGTESPSRKED